MNISNSFKIVALMDGTTLNGYLRVEKCPLVQRYQKGTTECTPNFEKMAEMDRPLLIPVVKDSAGQWKSIHKYEWKYNGITLTFDNTGLSTNPGFEGTFKRIASYQFQYSSSEIKTTIALRVMKNLYTLGNIDNDRISCSCEVEVSGHPIKVEDMYKDVIIEEATGEPWSMYLNNADINESTSSVIMKPTIYRNGKHVEDIKGLDFLWYKYTETGWEDFGVGFEKSVSAGDVNGSIFIKCVLTVDNSTVSATANIEDYSDPYYVDFQKTGLSGDFLKPGCTAVIKPVARKRSTGSIDSAFNQWEFYIRDNSGAVIPSKGEVFTADKLTMEYAEVMSAGGAISGFVKSKNNA